MKLEMINPTNVQTGLRKEEVDLNKKNTTPNTTSQSYGDIIVQHVFTLFNGINIFLFILICMTKSYKNGLFMGVVLFNLGIGIIQSIRAKRMLDKLTILNQKKTKVIRDGKEIEIPIDEVVVNDIVLFELGNQISFDCILIDGLLECNESNLTGESDPVTKTKGDTLFSASFVVAGSGKAQVMKVQEDTYAYSIIREAKKVKLYPSDLRDSMNKIVKICTILLIPIGALLFFKQMYSTTWQNAILSMVAAVIGMIPSGLILLTSIALAVGSIRLAKKQILIKELYCQETLARVDTLCLDKTGTITEGIMKVVKVDPFHGYGLEEIKRILAKIYGSINATNSTARAINAYANSSPSPYLRFIPFSSTRKGLGIEFEEGSYVCGSYTNLFSIVDEEVKNIIDGYACQGMRVIVLAKTEELQEDLLGNHELMAIICIQDSLKKDIRTTLDYFKQQGVDIKIISGDDASTIAYVTKQAGLNYDVINLTDDTKIEDVAENNQAFGRVKPEQKRELVRCLKNKGHTVAMIGDGVNDILALKEADCSITFKNGSEACQNVASIVLLDNQFENLPAILKQGRNIINNIEKSASLFLVKTLFSIGLSIVALLFLKNYPFFPIQLTLISALTVGIPGFILSLEPNDERVTGSFLKKVFVKAIPGAVCVVVTVLILNVLSNYIEISEKQLSTLTMLLTAWNTFITLGLVCRPFTKIRIALIISAICVFVISATYFGNIFYIVALSSVQNISMVIIAFVMGVGQICANRFNMKKVI